MPSRFVLTIMDHGRELSTVDFTGVSLSAANFDAQVTLQGNLETAILPFIIGAVHKRSRVASEAIITTNPPASALAQREVKGLIRYHDNVTGKKYRRELPTFDLLTLDTNEESVDPGDADFIALKAAFEAYVLSEDGNAVIMDSLSFVARNT